MLRSFIVALVASTAVLAAHPLTARAATCPPVSASCYSAGDGAPVCFEALAGEPNQAEFKTACANGHGTYATTACPTASRVGSCTTTEIQGLSGANFHFYTPFPVKYVGQACDQLKATACD